MVPLCFSSFCGVRGGYKAMSGSSRVFREYPTWCSLSLRWFTFETSNQHRDKLVRFESLPQRLLFCRFLNGAALQSVLVVGLFVFFFLGGVYGATNE